MKVESLKIIKQSTATKSLVNRGFNYIMGIFAIFFPFISLYISLRLFSRSRLSWLFILVTFSYSLILFYVLAMFWKLDNLLVFTEIIFPFLVSGIIILAAMRYRRKTWLDTGKWTVKQSFVHHKLIYASSLVFYFFIIFYLESLSFTLNFNITSLLFYVFVIILTVYYLILGFGIAAVGKEIKKSMRKLISAFE